MRGAAHNVHATEASSVRQHVVAAHQPQDATCGVQHTTRSVQHGAYRLARTAQAVVWAVVGTPQPPKLRSMGYRTGTGATQRGAMRRGSRRRMARRSARQFGVPVRHVRLLVGCAWRNNGIRAPRIVINGTEVCDDGAKRNRTTRPVGLRYPQARLFGWGCQQPRAHRGRSGEGLLSECACARARAGAGL